MSTLCRVEHHLVVKILHYTYKINTIILTSGSELYITIAFIELPCTKQDIYHTNYVLQSRTSTHQNPNQQQETNPVVNKQNKHYCHIVMP